MLPRGPGRRLCIQRGFSRAAAPSCRAPLRQQIDRDGEHCNRKISEECSKVAGFSGVRGWDLCWTLVVEARQGGCKYVQLASIWPGFLQVQDGDIIPQEILSTHQPPIFILCQNQQHQAERKPFSNPQPSGQHHEHELESLFSSPPPGIMNISWKDFPIHHRPAASIMSIS